MKIKTLILVSFLGALLFCACGKDKKCRCAVPGSQSVHVLKIEKGNCIDLATYKYLDQYGQTNTDSLYCVEY